ncbi:hypothetical protein THIOSC15_2530008 [uncultured Thiomicrorhabdus sp.]
MNRNSVHLAIFLIKNGDYSVFTALFLGMDFFLALCGLPRPELSSRGRRPWRSTFTALPPFVLGWITSLAMVDPETLILNLFQDQGDGFFIQGDNVFSWHCVNCRVAVAPRNDDTFLFNKDVFLGLAAHAKRELFEVLFLYDDRR